VCIAMTDFPKRLVFVDDEPDIRRVVRDIIERVYPDIMLVTCASGEELLSRLRELQPDLILLDLRMPVMSGPDVVQMLRKREEGMNVPVIFVTGATRLEMTDEYKELGVIGVIHKPFDVMKLPNTIGEFWRAFIETKLV
jgi:CheY-like chemotaxis protein